MSEVKFTKQETDIINYLVPRNNTTVYWEELVQFAKDPTTVKLKTIRKAVSELKRKCSLASVPMPFNVSFQTMSLNKETEPMMIEEDLMSKAWVNACEMGKQPLSPPQPQKLVPLKRASIPNHDGDSMTTSNQSASPSAHSDFVLDRTMRRVKTKYGYHLLNEREWDVMKYLHENVGKVIRISELRDEVLYPQYGSKLPPRWFDHIKTVVGHLRAQVPGLKERILTVKGSETGYLFQ